MDEGPRQKPGHQNEAHREGHRPAGRHTYKGVPGTLLRNGDGVLTYWSPDWASGPELAAA